MKKDLYLLLNIEEKEKTSVLLFLVQSVFLGIFYGAFDVGAHALFLSVYPASMIPKAYVVSGIVGIVLTTIYARIQSRYKFSVLAFINLLFITIVIVLLRGLFEITEQPWVVFLVFLMMGPLNILAMLGFWGSAGRIFTLRQGKRLFGLVDSGQIFGAIISTFAIPVLITFGFSQKNLLVVSSISVLVAFLIQIIITFKYNLNQVVVSEEKKESHRLPQLLKDKFVFNMAVFVVMSMLAAFFIQYSFLSVTKDNYPDHDNMTEFLGAFTGSLLLFTFLFKTFVYSKLMKTYGLKVSILISAFLLGIFAIAAVIIGTFAGYTSVTAGFIFFFLIISLSRLFSKALKDAVEVPSFKLLYQSLKAEIRHDVQAYVDGTINEIAALSAGLLLAVLGLFEFFKLIHFSYALLVILIIWFFVSRKLYIEYKLALQKSLSEYKGKKHEEYELAEILNQKIDSEHVSDKQVISNLKVFYQLHPYKYENRFEQIALHNKGELGRFAIGKIVEKRIIDSIPKFNKDHIYKFEDKDILDQFNLLVKKFGEQIDRIPTKESIINLSKSKNPEERLIAAFLIGKYYDEKYFVILKALLRDLNSEVKISAIKAVSMNKLTEFCPAIIDYLDTPGIFTVANDALVTIGKGALPYLDQAFYKTGTAHNILLRIIKIIGEIGGPNAIKILLHKLDHPNNEILSQVLNQLRKNNFNADENSINQIHQILEKHMGVIGWNLAASATLRDTNTFDYLKDAINQELKSNYDFLYMLLSMAYDAKSIMHVKENIESGTSEGASFALELLDLFIYEEIKPKLFPIIEDISIIEKIRQLQNFYPVEKLSLNDLLIAIINRDINEISMWTKSCALYAFSDLNDYSITNDLIAHLYNPNDILRQTAAYSISVHNKGFLEKIGYRIDTKYREEFEQLFSEETNSRFNLLIEKTLFLKNIEYFKQASGNSLMQLARNLNEVNPDASDDFKIDFLNLRNKIIFIRSGSITIKSGTTELILKENDIFDFRDLMIHNINDLYFEKDQNTILYLLNDSDLLNCMFDNHEIEISVLKWINAKFENAEK
jgi:ATP:ADP antiporter, AAA family